MRPVCSLLRGYSIPVDGLLPARIGHGMPLFRRTLRFTHGNNAVSVADDVSRPITPTRNVTHTIRTNVPLTHIALDSSNGNDRPFFSSRKGLARVNITNFRALLRAIRILIGSCSFDVDSTLHPLADDMTNFLGLAKGNRVLPNGSTSLLIVAPRLHVRRMCTHNGLVIGSNGTYIGKAFRATWAIIDHPGKHEVPTETTSEMGHGK